MRILIAICLLCTLIGAVTGCARDPVGQMPADLPNVFTKPQAQAKAATSTAAQSAELAPVVLTATGAGLVAIGAGVYLKDPHLVAAGAATSGGALALQRFLPWIPWLLAGAMAYLALRYAIKHHLCDKLLKSVRVTADKDRAKLVQVAAQVSDVSKGATFDSIAKDLDAHLQ